MSHFITLAWVGPALLACGITPACAQSTSAQAQSLEAVTPQRQTIRLGSVALTPVLALDDAGFDSNVFGRRHAQGDWTATLRPELALQWRHGKARVSANGAADIVYFQQFATERSIDTHDHVRLDWPISVARIRASYAFVNTRQRVGDDLDFRTRRVEHEARIGADRPVGARTSVSAVLQQTSVDFAEDALTPLGSALREVLARTVRTLSVSARYTATRRTAVALTAEHDRTRFQVSPLRGSSGIRIGPDVQLTSRGPLRGHAFVGYRRFDLADPYVPGFSGVVSDVDLQYVAFGATSFGVEGGRDVAYSSRFDEPYYLRSMLRGSMAQRLNRSWEFGCGVARRWLDYREHTGPAPSSMARFEGPLTERVLGFDATVGHRLGAGTRLVAEAAYERRSSPSSRGRNYDRLRMGMGVRYGF